MKILIIDDEKILCEMLVEQINSMEGYSASGCTESQEAEKKIKTEGGFSVIITDLMLPGTTIDDVLKSVRWIKKGSDSPHIIVMSGCLMNELQIPLKESKCDEVLQKPFSLQVLRKALDAVKKGK